MIWLTADTHLGHANILKYCARPFRSVEEHDEAIVSRWNALVQPGDDVYHLGDFAWWRLSADQVVALRRRLNGRIHLVLGNHDRGPDGLPTLGVLEALHGEHSSPGDSYHDYLEIRVAGDGRPRPLEDRGRGRRAVLFHYALEGWQDSLKAVHLHGHHPGRMRPQAGRLDVGVDCTGFAPLSWPEAVAAAQRGRAGFPSAF